MQEKSRCGSFVTSVLIAGFMLLAALFSASALTAQTATVLRDGSLVFELANERSAVLDILPRGTRVEWVEKNADWTQVILRNPTRRGFIRTGSLTPEGEAAVAEPVPAAAPVEQVPAPEQAQAPVAAARPPAVTERTQSPAMTGGLYASLMQRLDGAETSIRRLEHTLSEIGRMIDTLNSRARQTQPVRVGQDAGMKSVEPRLKETGSESGGRPGWVLYPQAGYYFERKEILAGAGILWRPSRLKGICLELGAGYLFQDSSSAHGSTVLDLGALVPLGFERRAFAPYLIAGAGLVRRNYRIAGQDPRLNFAADFGLGSFINLSPRTALRLEIRSTVEFERKKNSSDQSAGISLNHWL